LGDEAISSNARLPAAADIESARAGRLWQRSKNRGAYFSGRLREPDRAGLLRMTMHAPATGD
jgi:hypothetical protein